MRNLKKVLGLVLCLAMMLSIMVVGAGAAFADQSDIDTKHQDAVDMCNALNIITGFENGKFMPKDNVTREQMAKMICVLDNGGKEPQLATGNTFTDVPADRWSNKYIESCAARGVVVGTGGGKFSPAGKVTATQAAKMLLVELGYDDDIQKYSGSNWATQVNIDATRKGYYEDLEDIDVNAPLTREHAAQMIWNALQAAEVEYTYTLVTNPDGSISSKVTVSDKHEYGDNSDKLTLLEDKYGASVEVGYLTNSYYDSNKDEYTYTLTNSKIFGGDSITDDPVPNNGKFKSDVDYSDLFGQKVKVVYKDAKDIFGIYAYESSVLYSGIVSDLPAIVAGDDSVKIDGTTYDLDAAANAFPVYAFNVVNQNADTGAAKLYANNASYETASTGYYAFELIDNDDNGDANVMVVHPVKVAQLTYATSSEVRIGSGIITDKNKFTYEDENIYSGAAKDDWAVITEKANTVDGKYLIEKIDLITGKVTAVKSDNSIKVDGTEYSKAANANKTPQAKDKVEIVSYNGYYFNVDGVSTALDVAVVTGIGNWDSMNEVLPVKLMFKDGTETIVNVEKWGNATTEAGMTGINGTAKKDVMVAFEVDDEDYTLVTVSDGADVKVSDSASTDYKGLLKTEITPLNAVKYDKDKAAILVGTKENNTTTYSNTYDIADDAIVILKNDDGDYTCMTGADLLKKNAIDFNLATGGKGVGAFYAAVDGNEVGALFGYVGNASVSSGDSLYAFVLDAYSEVNGDDKEMVYLDVVVDGEKKEGVETNKKAGTNGSNVNTYKPAQNNGAVVVEYTMDGDVMNIVKSYALASFNASTPNTLYNLPIKESNDSRVLFYNGVASYADPTKTDAGTFNTERYLLTKDTQIIAFDSSDKNAYAGNSLSEAAVSVFDKNNNAYNYHKNAWFIYNSDTELQVVFVDVNAPTARINDLVPAPAL